MISGFAEVICRGSIRTVSRGRSLSGAETHVLHRNAICLGDSITSVSGLDRVRLGPGATGGLCGNYSGDADETHHRQRGQSCQSRRVPSAHSVRGGDRRVTVQCTRRKQVMARSLGPRRSRCSFQNQRRPGSSDLSARLSIGTAIRRFGHAKLCCCVAERHRHGLASPACRGPERDLSNTSTFSDKVFQVQDLFPRKSRQKPTQVKLLNF